MGRLPKGKMKMRKILMASVCLMALASPTLANGVPKFAQFPAREYSHKPTGRVDLSTSNAYDFRTRLREGARQKANFAGHYVVVTWGCGTNCNMGAVVD